MIHSQPDAHSFALFPNPVRGRYEFVPPNVEKDLIAQFKVTAEEEE